MQINSQSQFIWCEATQTNDIVFGSMWINGLTTHDCKYRMLTPGGIRVKLK